MFNYFQQLLILSFSITTLIAMENDKKPIFVPTTNTSQANADLLKILALRQTKGLQEEDWKNIRKCLENGADPDLKSSDSSQTPLIYLAAGHDKKELFEYLLQLGADISASDDLSWTPLHIFIFNFHNTPTNLAISYLLQKGAKPNAINKSKETPFTYAVQYNCLDFIQPLIQYRADINHTTLRQTTFADENQYYITTPLGWAIKNSLRGHRNFKTIEMLCKAGALTTNIDNEDHTVFHLAANKPEKVIKTLLAHSRFNDDDDKITNTIKTALLVFNRLSHPLESELQENSIKFPQMPHEIQILILSKLLSPNFFHKGLYKQCKGENYQQLPLKLVNEHVQHLRQILRIKNNNQVTATELIPEWNIVEAKFLLDGSKLQNDLDILNETYPDITSISQDNLARQIFENHYKFQHITKEQINV